MPISPSLSVAGHTTQRDTDNEEEEDGKYECNYIPRALSSQTNSVLTDIITCDDQEIQDNVPRFSPPLETHSNMLY